MQMHITIISDTHNEHEKFDALSGEVLIHCGDMFNLFDRNEDDFERMDEWFGRQDFDMILCTGGNHDFALENRVESCAQPFENAVYLQDKTFVHEGVTFYGAPWTPLLKGHAFFRQESELSDKWQQIPDDTDVLITHTPPAGVLDISSRGLELGCRHLADTVGRVSPQLHCFGHVHASSGVREVGNTTFINASSVNSQFELARPPYEFIVRS
jgi:Icc-related predicted phosphoesterase